MPDGKCEACLLDAAVLAQFAWHAYWVQQALCSVLPHDGVIPARWCHKPHTHCMLT